jgi:hypothetical protein
LLVGVALLGLVFLGAAEAGRADTMTQLPFTGDAPWMAVDPSGSHVFVSDGPGNSSIVVLNFSGQIVKTITGESGASQMALDPATHTLYVALHDSSAISEIDTQTLTETKRFSTSPFSAPTGLVIAGGKLWFSCRESYSSGCLVAVNLDGTGMTSSSNGQPLFLAAGGSNSHLLAYGYTDGQPTPIEVYDVSGNTPTLVSKNDDLSRAVVRDMTFDPSGAHVLLATVSPAYIDSLNATTGLSSAEYPTGPSPVSVAVTADGNYVAGGIAAKHNGAYVFVYPVGDTTPVRTWDIGVDGLTVLPHSLAFSPDASKLFELTQRSSSGHLVFVVLQRPTVQLTATQTSLHRSATVVRYGGRVQLEARVTGATTGTVELRAATPLNGPEHLATGKLKSGRVTFSVEPKRKTGYSVKLDDGLTYASSTSSTLAVNVRPILSVVTHPHGTGTFGGKRAAVTQLVARIQPARSHEVVLFAVQCETGGSWRLAGAGAALLARGSAHLNFITAKSGLCRARAGYLGDAAYATSLSPWASFQVTVP